MTEQRYYGKNRIIRENEEILKKETCHVNL